MDVQRNRRRLITALRCGVYPQGSDASPGCFSLSSLIITLFAPPSVVISITGGISGPPHRIIPPTSIAYGQFRYQTLCCDHLAITTSDLEVYDLLGFNDVAQRLENLWFPTLNCVTFLAPSNYFCVEPLTDNLVLLD